MSEAEDAQGTAKQIAPWDNKGKIWNMMQKMGFAGGGLGANADGITEAVTIKARTNREGLGLGVESTVPMSAPFTEPKIDPSVPPAQSSHHGLRHSPAVAALRSSPPELKMGLLPKRDHINASITSIEQDISVLSNVLLTVEQIHSQALDFMHSTDRHSIALLRQQIQKQLSQWQSIFEASLENYRKFNLEALSFKELEPLMNQWITLNETSGASVNSILTDFTAFASSTSHLFPLILDRFMVPVIRDYMTNAWDPLLDAADGIELIGTCFTEPSIPQPVANEIVSTALIPKLIATVRAIRPFPFGESHNIHLWIQPWIRILPQDTNPLLDLIEDKFVDGMIREPWPASDLDVSKTLALWSSMLGPHRLKSLTQLSILPHLNISFSALDFTPGHTRTGPFIDSIRPWLQSLSPIVVARALELFWFPKWKASLITWLRAKPDFRVVKAWYLAWRQAIGEELIQCIQKEMRQILELIDSEITMRIINR